MKLDIFSETQKKDCEKNGGFSQILKETLEQAEEADKVGFDCWWQVEHHCSTDFSNSSCPEMILQAIASRTKRLRVGHSGILVPFKINHPLRAAERVAFLDQISEGRVEVGLAKSGGKEWETFSVEEEEAAENLEEATFLMADAWTKTPFSWKSDRWEVGDRDVLPKVFQTPHPRIWHTCSSPNSFKKAGELGVGVLGTTLFSPISYVSDMLKGYRDAINECKNQATRIINNEAGIFTFVHVRDSEKEAIQSGAPRSALWYVSSAPRVFNVPREVWYDAIRSQTNPRSSSPSYQVLDEAEKPGENKISDSNPVISLLEREFAGEEISNEEIYETIKDLDSVIIGDVKTCKRKIEAFYEAGVDRLLCLVQMGEIPHDQVLETIRVIGKELVPYFSNKQ